MDRCDRSSPRAAPRASSSGCHSPCQCAFVASAISGRARISASASLARQHAFPAALRIWLQHEHRCHQRIDKLFVADQRRASTVRIASPCHVAACPQYTAHVIEVVNPRFRRLPRRQVTLDRIVVSCRRRRPASCAPANQILPSPLRPAESRPGTPTPAPSTGPAASAVSRPSAVSRHRFFALIVRNSTSSSQTISSSLGASPGPLGGSADQPMSAVGSSIGHKPAIGEALRIVRMFRGLSCLLDPILPIDIAER